MQSLTAWKLILDLALLMLSFIALNAYTNNPNPRTRNYRTKTKNVLRTKICGEKWNWKMKTATAAKFARNWYVVFFLLLALLFSDLQLCDPRILCKNKSAKFSAVFQPKLQKTTFVSFSLTRLSFAFFILCDVRESTKENSTQSSGGLRETKRDKKCSAVLAGQNCRNSITVVRNQYSGALDSQLHSLLIQSASDDIFILISSGCIKKIGWQSAFTSEIRKRNRISERIFANQICLN